MEHASVFSPCCSSKYFLFFHVFFEGGKTKWHTIIAYGCTTDLLRGLMRKMGTDILVVPGVIVVPLFLIAQEVMVLN